MVSQPAAFRIILEQVGASFTMGRIMALPEPLVQQDPMRSTDRGLRRGLLAGGIVLALAAGGLLWASQGEGVFLAWLSAAVAGCM